MIEVEEMKYHMPGWTVDIDLGGNREASFKLWAPTAAREQRERWAASWDSYEVEDAEDEHPHIVDGTEDADFRHGDTMDEALAVLDSYPDADLAARVRRLLSGAARDHVATTEPNGDN